MGWIGIEDKWERTKYEWKISNFTREKAKYRVVGYPEHSVYRRFQLSFYKGKLVFCVANEVFGHSSTMKVALQTTDNKLDYCFRHENVWECLDRCEYVKIKDIFNNSSKYLKEDTLTIVFYIEEYLYDNDYCDEDYEYNCRYKKHEALSEMYGKLFNSEDFSDVKIVCNDGIEFPAHQCILASRSPVFKAMLTHDTHEKKTQRIEIDDINGKTMLEVLRFIYTGKAEKLDNLASTVIYAAEKYDLEWLKKMCGWKLAEGISADCALKYLKIADCVNEPLLLEESLSCINTNVTELEDTDEWKTMDSALMAEITAYIEEKAADVVKLTSSL